MIISDNAISVHGREGLVVPYQRFTTLNNVETQTDISARAIFFEVRAGKLRLPLVANPDDVLGLQIVLTRDDVEKLPTTPCPFIVIDESGQVPTVEWEGTIKRVGYAGDPSE